MTVDGQSPSELPSDGDGQRDHTSSISSDDLGARVVVIRSRPFESKSFDGTVGVWNLQGSEYQQLSISVRYVTKRDDDRMLGRELSDALDAVIRPGDTYKIRLELEAPAGKDARIAAIPPLMELFRRGAALSSDLETHFYQKISDPTARLQLARIATRIVAPNLSPARLFSASSDVAERVRQTVSDRTPLYGIVNLQIPVDVRVAGFLPTTRTIPFGYVMLRQFLASPDSNRLFTKRPSESVSPVMLWPDAQALATQPVSPRDFDYSIGARVAAQSMNPAVLFGTVGGLFSGALLTVATTPESAQPSLIPATVGALGIGSLIQAATLPFNRETHSERVQQVCDKYGYEVRRHGAEPL